MDDESEVVFWVPAQSVRLVGVVTDYVIYDKTYEMHLCDESVKFTDTMIRLVSCFEGECQLFQALQARHHNLSCTAEG